MPNFHDMLTFNWQNLTAYDWAVLVFFLALLLPDKEPEKAIEEEFD